MRKKEYLEVVSPGVCIHLPTTYLLFAQKVLTNMVGGLGKQTSLSLSPSAPAVKSFLCAAIHKLRASPHFHLIMRTQATARLLNPLSFPTETMAVVSTPQASSCTWLPRLAGSCNVGLANSWNMPDAYSWILRTPVSLIICPGAPARPQVHVQAECTSCINSAGPLVSPSSFVGPG